MKEDTDYIKCTNCGTKGNGAYCSHCGQKYASLNRPVRELIDELLDSLNIDRRIIKTLVPFVLKPGFLAAEYLQGRRKTYVSPLRLYLLMSLVFFFLAQATSKKLVEYSDNAKLTISSDTTDQRLVLDDSTAIEMLKNDSIFLGSRDTTGTAAGIRKEERRTRFQEAMIKALSDEVVYIQQFYKNISYLLFMLMPAFALILKFLYVRRKRLYVEHLVFALNMHSFALLLLSVILILKFLFPSIADAFNLIFFAFPVYFGKGMKRYYNQAWFKTLIKEAILTILYSTLLIVCFLVVLILTLYFL